MLRLQWHPKRLRFAYANTQKYKTTSNANHPQPTISGSSALSTVLIDNRLQHRTSQRNWFRDADTTRTQHSPPLPVTLYCLALSAKALPITEIGTVFSDSSLNRWEIWLNSLCSFKFLLGHFPHDRGSFITLMLVFLSVHIPSLGTSMFVMT